MRKRSGFDCACSDHRNRAGLDRTPRMSPESWGRNRQEGRWDCHVRLASGSGPPAWEDEPWLKAWLSDRLGVDYFSDVALVTYGTRGCVAESVQLGPDHPLDLRCFRPLVLTEVRLTHLEGLKSLRSLNLAGTDVSDKDLASLKSLNCLEDVWLDNTGVRGVGLAYLKGLSSLRTLSLWHAPLNDEALTHLEDLPQLRCLCLDGTPITDAAMVHLETLQRLERLFLKGTRVTDAGVAHLENFCGFEICRWRRRRLPTPVSSTCEDWVTCSISIFAIRG